MALLNTDSEPATLLLLGCFTPLPPRYLIKSFSIVGCPQGMGRMRGHQPREVVVVVEG